MRLRDNPKSNINWHAVGGRSLLSVVQNGSSKRFLTHGVPNLYYKSVTLALSVSEGILKHDSNCLPEGRNI